MRVRLLVTILSVAIAASARGDAQIDAAIRALRSDSSLKVRAQAAIILGQRGAAEAVGTLADAARNDSSEAVRLACVSALAKIGDPAGQGAIEAATRDSDYRVRAAAQKAMLAFAVPGPVAPGAIAVFLEEATGKGDAALKAEFRKSLERHLREQGFSVVARGQKYVLKPSVLVVDVEKADGRTVVAVRATLVAVDHKGGMTAMLEGGAKVKAIGAATSSMVPKYTAKAMDVAARTLTDDLKERLKPGP
jgi:HEAT repeat protein